MTATDTTLRLPDIALSELPEKTKDFILARASATGATVSQTIRAVLSESAKVAGFEASEKVA